MNPFEMVAMIVGMALIAGVLKAKYAHRGDQAEHGKGSESVENARLRDEVKQLKDRIHVLERIAVEKEDTLSRQIEELRDR